jgi:hypothetical protein
VIQPRPAPKTPRPIRDDPKVGTVQVVMSLRLDPYGTTPTQIRDHFERLLIPALVRSDWQPYDLYVTATEIGAGGERSEHEGTIGLTEDDIERAPLRADVPVTGERL